MKHEGERKAVFRKYWRTKLCETFCYASLVSGYVRSEAGMDRGYVVVPRRGLLHRFWKSRRERGDVIEPGHWCNLMEQLYELMSLKGMMTTMMRVWESEGWRLGSRGCWVQEIVMCPGESCIERGEPRDAILIANQCK